MQINKNITHTDTTNRTEGMEDWYTWELRFIGRRLRRVYVKHSIEKLILEEPTLWQKVKHYMSL